MPDADDRRAAIRRILDDLPPVHAFGAMSYAPEGVWHTDLSLYEWLALVCHEGMATLETGCGVSTVLFALWRTDHTCVTPSEEEVTRLRAYCESRDIPLDTVDFAVGPSDEVLPRLSADGKLDLVLIDGGHAFPLPIIDWYYAGGRLDAGGILVVDDLQLPPVSHALLAFLEGDRRWGRLQRNDKWAGYHRLNRGPLREEWGLQMEMGIFDGSRIHRAAELGVRGVRCGRALSGRALRAVRRAGS